MIEEDLFAIRHINKIIIYLEVSVECVRYVFYLCAYHVHRMVPIVVVDTIAGYIVGVFVRCMWIYNIIACWLYIIFLVVYHVGVVATFES